MLVLGGGAQGGWLLAFIVVAPEGGRYNMLYDYVERRHRSIGKQGINP